MASSIRSSWTVSSFLQFVKTVTKGFTNPELTPELILSIINTKVGIINQQLEAILWEHNLKRATNLSTVASTLAVLSKNSGVNGTYSAATKTLTWITANNSYLGAFLAGMDVIVTDNTGAVAAGKIYSFTAGSTITIVFYDNIGLATAANAIQTIVGISGGVSPVKILNLPSDCKKPIFLYEQTSLRPIEFVDERKFQAIQNNITAYAKQTWATVIEDKIYIYTPPNVTGPTLFGLYYIRKTDKLTNTAFTETIDLPDEFIDLLLTAVKQTFFEVGGQSQLSIAAIEEKSVGLNAILQSYQASVLQLANDVNLNSKKHTS